MTGPDTPAGPVRWDALSERIRGCTACSELAASRQHVVVGEAPPGARLLFVGEAPGASEDEQGRPFVGKAGQVLDGALAAAGLSRDEVAVANVLKCRPPGNRRPLPDEIGRCRGWLDEQLALIAPALIVPLGLTSISWFLGPGKFLLREVRGRVHEIGERRVLPTYHPSGALRYGPNGEPMQALRADVALAASLTHAA
ncbi:MAG TPA: uracil-DNA glycosylase [Frankiaceae bacterium]|nr:uracil-DNA glycosylase [Frankiaceae bacterium]